MQRNRLSARPPAVNEAAIRTNATRGLGPYSTGLASRLPVPARTQVYQGPFMPSMQAPSFLGSARSDNPDGEVNYSSEGQRRIPYQRSESSDLTQGDSYHAANMFERPFGERHYGEIDHNLRHMMDMQMQPMPLHGNDDKSLKRRRPCEEDDDDLDRPMSCTSLEFKNKDEMTPTEKNLMEYVNNKFSALQKDKREAHRHYEAKFAAKIESLTKDHDAKLAAQKESLTKDFDAKFASLTKDHDAKLAAQKESLTKDHDAKLAAQKESLTKDFDAKFASLTKDHDAKLAAQKESLTKDFDAKFASLTKDHDAKLAAQKESLTKDHDTKLAAQKESLTRDFDAKLAAQQSMHDTYKKEQGAKHEAFQQQLFYLLGLSAGGGGGAILGFPHQFPVGQAASVATAAFSAGQAQGPSLSHGTHANPAPPSQAAPQVPHGLTAPSAGSDPMAPSINGLATGTADQDPSIRLEVEGVMNRRIDAVVVGEDTQPVPPVAQAPAPVVQAHAQVQLPPHAANAPMAMPRARSYIPPCRRPKFGDDGFPFTSYGKPCLMCRWSPEHTLIRCPHHGGERKAPKRVSNAIP